MGFCYTWINWFLLGNLEGFHCFSKKNLWVSLTDLYFAFYEFILYLMDLYSVFHFDGFISVLLDSMK